MNDCIFISPTIQEGEEEFQSCQIFNIIVWSFAEFNSRCLYIYMCERNFVAEPKKNNSESSII